MNEIQWEGHVKMMRAMMYEMMGGTRDAHRDTIMAIHDALDSVSEDLVSPELREIYNSYATETGASK